MYFYTYYTDMIKMNCPRNDETVVSNTGSINAITTEMVEKIKATLAGMSPADIQVLRKKILKKSEAHRKKLEVERRNKDRITTQRRLENKDITFGNVA